MCFERFDVGLRPLTTFRSTVVLALCDFQFASSVLVGAAVLAHHLKWATIVSRGAGRPSGSNQAQLLALRHLDFRIS